MEVEIERCPSGEATGWSREARAARYDRDSNRSFYRRALERLLDGTPEVAGRGLDLGCGTGFSTELLLERQGGVAWSGVDSSPAMLDLARGKPKLRAVTFHQGHAEALPFPSASFDVVVANFAWHWFGDGAGQEVRRVLRPGGWVWLSVPLRRPSHANGNRALARELLAQRHRFSRLTSQGLRFEEVPTLIPGAVRISRLQLAVEKEQLADGVALLDALESRGALAAIFGRHPPKSIRVPSPVELEWPFAILHAQV